MIEPTDEMVMALWRLLPSEVQEGREPDDIRPWVAVVCREVDAEWDRRIARPRTVPHCPVVDDLCPGDSRGVLCLTSCGGG